MKAKKYDKVQELPTNAIKVSTYAEQIGQNNPPYICVAYDRWLKSPATVSYPGYKIVNWQGYNFVVPD